MIGEIASVLEVILVARLLYLSKSMRKSSEGYVRVGIAIFGPLLLIVLAENPYATAGEASIMVCDVFRGFYSSFPLADHPAARNSSNFSNGDSSYSRASLPQTLTSLI